MPNNLRTHVNVLIMLNLVLACVSLLKDMFVARYLGTTHVADSFTLAFFIPDTIGNNLIASAIGVACIPIFSRLSYKSLHSEYIKVILRLTLLFMFVTGGISILLYTFGFHLFVWLGQGLSTDVLLQSFSYFKWLVPTIILYPLVMIASAILQTENQFFLPGIAPVIFNVIFLLSTIMCVVLDISTSMGSYVIAISISLAVLIQVLLLWVTVFRSNKWYLMRNTLKRSTWRRHTTYLRAIIKIFIPYLIILLSSQCILVVERGIASTLGVGNIAGLNYAYRISQFPMWVFVAALNTVLFPTMSKWISAKNDEALRVNILKTLKIILFLTVAMSVSFYLLRVPLVSFLLQRGAFNHHSLVITTDILSGYSLSIVGQSITLVGIRFYLAKRNMRYPITLLLLTMVLTILLDFILTGKMGVAGLGYGTAIGASINGLVFLILLLKELRTKQHTLGGTIS